MAERGNALSRNPNICAACSSLADGMDDTTVSELFETPTSDPFAPKTGQSSATEEVVLQAQVPAGDNSTLPS
jgi:hypothetical protein